MLTDDEEVDRKFHSLCESDNGNAIIGNYSAATGNYISAKSRANAASEFKAKDKMSAATASCCDKNLAYGASKEDGDSEIENTGEIILYIQV